MGHRRTRGGRWANGPSRCLVVVPNPLVFEGAHGARLHQRIDAVSVVLPGAIEHRVVDRRTSTVEVLDGRKEERYALDSLAPRTTGLGRGEEAEAGGGAGGAASAGRRSPRGVRRCRASSAAPGRRSRWGRRRSSWARASRPRRRPTALAGRRSWRGAGACRRGRGSAWSAAAARSPGASERAACRAAWRRRRGRRGRCRAGAARAFGSRGGGPGRRVRRREARGAWGGCRGIRSRSRRRAGLRAAGRGGGHRSGDAPCRAWRRRAAGVGRADRARGRRRAGVDRERGWEEAQDERGERAQQCQARKPPPTRRVNPTGPRAPCSQPDTHPRVPFGIPRPSETLETISSVSSADSDERRRAGPRRPEPDVPGA